MPLLAPDFLESRNRNRIHEITTVLITVTKGRLLQRFRVWRVQNNAPNQPNYDYKVPYGRNGRWLKQIR
jgi:hypothetical protein